jgi:hypothetical protein
MTDQRLAYGYALALVGVVFELAGLAAEAFVDGRVLTLDLPGFRLTHSSQSLLVIGLALKTAGLALVLALCRAGELRRAARLFAPVAALTPAVLIAAVVLDVGPGAQTATPAASGADVDAIVERAVDASDPTLREVLTVVREEGAAEALDWLEERAAAERSISLRGHFLAHEIGRETYLLAGDAGTAFSSCREIFESGCFHGVLESYLRSKPSIQQDDIAALCTSAIDTTSSQFVKFQCVHGLGHGLTMYFDHELFTALGYCDYLPTDWDKHSCYGGVFMENIVYPDTKYLKAEDPHYPCNAVEERYKASCYVMQSSAVLKFNDFDIAGAFRVCETAPEAYVSICYQSVGRDITGVTNRDPVKSLQMCGLGSPALRPQCYFAVAKQFIDVAGTTEAAFGFCRLVPADGKAACYQGIGEMVASLFADLSLRSQECAKAEAGYADSCARGAGV